MIREKKLWVVAVIVTLVLTLSTGCNKEENTLVFNKTKLAAVTGLNAFSYDANSVGLSWTRSVDSSKSDFADMKITVKDGSAEYLTRIISKTFSDSALIVGNLNPGTVYTFEIVSRAVSTSQNFSDSDPASIQWATARRLNGGAAMRVYEIASQDSSGLQFFDGVGSHVFPNDAGHRSILDVVMDSTSSTGLVLMKSGHLNPYGGGVRHTRFSTFDTLGNHLDVGRSAPPDPATYTRDSIFIEGPETWPKGRIFYAITQESNYVRVLLERNPSNGTLLFGIKPRRYISVKISYQFSGGIIFAKPMQHSSRIVN